MYFKKMSNKHILDKVIMHRNFASTIVFSINLVQPNLMPFDYFRLRFFKYSAATHVAKITLLQNSKSYAK